ncbi:dihydrofolate reductase family protein [Nesterenkonia sandarakina]|uniref:RibD domain-containing protein n=1 Tax=Nesterenkonia sandarakina TaxID=272918 RepID=A0A2T0YD47_9MICC|nr:dihydrofolate reductase family protein [Nesterenkonia sandarakina]PRZ12727.1 RibD domain-containing protein [Nesterenkonia sandarakina]
MAKLVAVEYVSLDGVMQAPGRADEDTRGGFSHGGWASELLAADPEAAQASMSGQNETVALMFGHRTYVDLLGHWLDTAEPNPFTEILRQTPKFVASRSADTQLAHPNSELLLAGAADTPAGRGDDGDGGDAVPAVRELKASLDGEVVILGSGELVRSLAAEDLIDAYLLTILPIALGSGARLFGDRPTSLAVTSSFTSPTGIVVATYEPVRAR